MISEQIDRLREVAVPVEFETANCSRCKAVLTYELLPGCTELESFMGACEDRDWETRNTVDGIRLLCRECVKADQFYRDENLGH